MRDMQQRLSAELANRAQTIGDEPAPYDAIGHRIVVSRRRRQVGSIVAAVASVLCVALLAGPGLSAVTHRIEVVQGTPGAAMFDWETRGSSADDEDYVGQTEQWLQEVNGDVDRVHTLYAGDIDESRLIIGVIEQDGVVESTAIRAPAGLESKPMSVEKSSDGHGEDVLNVPVKSDLVAFSVSSEEETLVAVPPPDTTRVELSPAWRYPKGTTKPQRTWEAMDKADGAFVETVSSGTLANPQVRAMQGETMATVDAWQVGPDRSAPDLELRDLAADASEGLHITGLAKSVEQIENLWSGTGSIISVDVPWEVEMPNGDWASGVLMYTADGGVLQAVSISGEFEIVRPIPSDRARSYPAMWTVGCAAVAFVPEPGLGIARMQTLVHDRSAGPPVSVDDVDGSHEIGTPEGSLAFADFCKSSSAARRLAEVGATRIELLTDKGKAAWSGNPQADFGYLGN